MADYRIVEKCIGDEIFYCVLINSNPTALFKQITEARDYIAGHLKSIRRKNSTETSSGAGLNS